MIKRGQAGMKKRLVMVFTVVLMLVLFSHMPSSTKAATSYSSLTSDSIQTEGRADKTGGAAEEKPAEFPDGCEGYQEEAGAGKK